MDLYSAQNAHRTAGKAAPVVDDALLERYTKISSGTLTSQLFKRGLRQQVLVGIRPLNRVVKPFAGRAFTMRFIPAREDIDTGATVTMRPDPVNLQWVGVEELSAGDVLVIDSRGDIRGASMGDILISRMQRRGARAVITDGAFRDGAEISRMEIPAWCAAVTATSRLSYHHVADLQVPIGCAEVAVYPGDVVHGDENNITIVPSYLAEEIIAACEAQESLEVLWSNFGGHF
ncbi:RraA family protein [Candidimonas nitroreducens]|uniref:Ribonuclease activity regulator RraA n=1 Tax=Candidimonas nitroreducens TaxID=683354 RepID=A0A225M003_9BURK|nr:ribonuclease activity regulator RraA [Candidimonas nitroreducens]OWT54526.1 ribonuclease activity regulator RraA [Candidimonas nitroreducens]